MRISAKADYAVRAAIELAAATDAKPVKAELIAAAQGIPLNFLENILSELRNAQIVRSQRGAEGGYRLARGADQVTIADIIRAVEGPLATVRGGRPEDAEYPGPASQLPRVWIAVRKNLRSVVELVTVADVANAEPAQLDQRARRRPRGLGHPVAGADHPLRQLVRRAAHRQVDGGSRHPAGPVGRHEHRHVRHLLDRHDPPPVGGARPGRPWNCSQVMSVLGLASKTSLIVLVSGMPCGRKPTTRMP